MTKKTELYKNYLRLFGELTIKYLKSFNSEIDFSKGPLPIRNVNYANGF